MTFSVAKHEDGLFAYQGGKDYYITGRADPISCAVGLR